MLHFVHPPLYRTLQFSIMPGERCKVYHGEWQAGARHVCGYMLDNMLVRMKLGHFKGCTSAQLLSRLTVCIVVLLFSQPPIEGVLRQHYHTLVVQTLHDEVTHIGHIAGV